MAVKLPKTTLPALLSLAIVAVTALLYAQVKGHLFLTYDDDIYITKNVQIARGLTLSGIIWAFTAIHESNWIPLTWISHMVDVSLYGLKPSGHHLTNVAIHTVNAILLFSLFCRLTGSLWRPGLLALLFAVHPLHVESVAWAAERKDLLCGLFFLLTLLCYANYAKHGRSRDYGLALFAFFLGILAKPMIVSLPLILLLLDQWPLARNTPVGDGVGVRFLLRDKAPFFLGSAVLALVTLIAQHSGGSIASLVRHPLPERLANAALATLAYVGKTLFPLRLAVFYPYPEALPLWQPILASLLLLAFTLWAVGSLKCAPYLTTGWLWFVITLLPVIGLVQVGEQAMADRYTYLPIIGLLIILVWGGEELCRRLRVPTALSCTTALILILLLAAVAWRQTRYWQNQHTLFAHAVAVTGDNPVATFQLGNGLVVENRLPEAADAFTRSLALKPSAKAYNNLAYAQERTGQADQALLNYRRAIELEPLSVESHYNLGLLLLRQWQTEEAIKAFDTVLILDPTHQKARENRERAQRVQEARRRP